MAEKRGMVGVRNKARMLLAEIGPSAAEVEIARLTAEMAIVSRRAARFFAELHEIRGMAQSGPSGMRADIIRRVDAALSAVPGKET
jgi:hypothetical protein